MWTTRYFPDRYFAPRYWARRGAAPPPPPPPPPVQGRVGFVSILLALRQRIIETTGMDESRVGVVVDPEQVPHFGASQDVLLVPRGEQPLIAIDGGGRYDNFRRRTVDLVLRSRRWLDRPDSDVVRLTDEALGHAVFEDSVVDGVELWTPLDPEDQTLALSLPVQVRDLSTPRRDRNDAGWLSSTLTCEIQYLRKLTLPEMTEDPPAGGGEAMIRSNLRTILLSLRQRIADEASLDLSRVIVTAADLRDIDHYGAIQDVLVRVEGERPEEAIDGGGRYVNKRKRKLTLSPRTRSWLDRPDRDLVKLTDATLGLFALEDRLADAVELWPTLDADNNAVALPVEVGAIQGATHDADDAGWVSSQMTLEFSYLRDLTLPEMD